MNSEDGNLPLRGAEDESDFHQSDDPRIEGFGNTDMKRAAAKQLIERYYYQLVDGCGKASCTNEFCASSGKAPSNTANQAAARALQLFRDKAKLCEPNPAKVAKFPSKMVENLIETNSSNVAQSSTTSSSEAKLTSNVDNSSPSTSESASKSDSSSVIHLTESRVKDMINICKEEGTYSLLIRTLGAVYSDANALTRSFLREVPVHEAKPLTKEDFRSSEADLDKDLDSKEDKSSQALVVPVVNPAVNTYEVSVDFESLNRAYEALFSVPGLPFQSALIHALNSVLADTALELKYHNSYEKNPDLINIFFTVLEIPHLHFDDFVEMSVAELCKAVSCLPIAGQAKFVRAVVRHRPEKIKYWVEVLHQLITSRIISKHTLATYCINDDGIVEAAVKFMKLFYYAAIMGGQLDQIPQQLPLEPEEVEPDENLQDLLQGVVRENKEPKQVKEDPLLAELNLTVLDCRKPLISYEEFYNDLLNEQIELNKDFQYKDDKTLTKFSFLNHHFILTTATKVLGLYYDNRVRMIYERRTSVLQSYMNGETPSPYLKLRIRRDKIIEDALIGLEMHAMQNPNDLKKQLVVEFDGEQGIDEGGVSKEFFQLIIEELFKPHFAMFTLNPETQTHWFNPTCFESDAQFTLIGILLGLAIYNNVILDIHFPSVVYRKLLGKRGVFEDLAEWDPSLYQGLVKLLEHQDEDIEEVFMQTFRISYKDVFGNPVTYDLKENGDKIPVNHENKREFVDLYAHFLLNKLVDKQFRAFKRGFQLVTDESPLKWLCRPDEVELIVCGSKVFDFNALEESTEYDGGYTAQSPMIKYFWEIVHDLSQTEKRQLLQFTTGSDRVPVGGLSKLKLIIARNGSDSNRLPTAHTCFNVLLLPEYCGKEKLRERLLKAITYSKGFGML